MKATILNLSSGSLKIFFKKIKIVILCTLSHCAVLFNYKLLFLQTRSTAYQLVNMCLFMCIFSLICV